MSPPTPSPRRIGIFGGSFDPVHFGHLILADSCREQLRLDEVRLIPAATSPLKEQGPVASDEHRAEMVQLAIRGADYLQIDRCELHRGGISYSLDTVQSLRQQDPSAELWLLVGADSVASMDRWHRIAELLRTVRLGVVGRGGHPPPDFEATRALLRPEDREAFEPRWVTMPAIEISSSDLRARIAAGASIRFRTPWAVQAYIDAQRLYAWGDFDSADDSVARPWE